MGNETHENLLHEQFLTRIVINKVCNEALFIHVHVTLEYFNFERENRFKRFAVYFYCFRDNCCRVISAAVGNGSNPHLNHHDHSFNESLDV